jgi:hypothetical protein
MLRIERDACGSPYAVEGPDGPLYADFHALRHSFIALLDKSGATLKEAMQLARHSDPKLTMAVSGRAALHDLGAAVERLPALTSAAEKKPVVPLRATCTKGTERAIPAITGVGESGMVTGMVTRPAAVSCREVSHADGAHLSAEETPESSNYQVSLELMPIVASCRLSSEAPQEGPQAPPEKPRRRRAAH